MKGLLLLILSFYLPAAAAARTDTSVTVSPKLTASWYTHLVDTNQSQTLEIISGADGFSRLPAYKTAKVHFIVGKSEQEFGSAGKDNVFSDPTNDYCAKLGFKASNCTSGRHNRECPYNDKIYDKCCDASYKYTASQCAFPRKLSSDACGGKYKCYCDSSSYPYASCNAPQIKGISCSDDNGARYASCTCPQSVATPYGCQSYYAYPCGSACQKAYADNCRNRAAAQTPYGCSAYWSDCKSKCQTAYKDNCRNRVAVSTPYGCQSAFADCASKCQTAYKDNCRNRTAVSAPYGCKSAWSDCPSKCRVALTACEVRTAVSAPYGCQQVWSDCPSKCQIAKTNPCASVTAVTIPANASCSGYYSICPSKCSDWKCNSGYVKSGNGCTCDTSVYVYTSSNCSGDLGGATCNGKYSYCQVQNSCMKQNDYLSDANRYPNRNYFQIRATNSYSMNSNSKDAEAKCSSYGGYEWVQPLCENRDYLIVRCY